MLYLDSTSANRKEIASRVREEGASARSGGLVELLPFGLNVPRNVNRLQRLYVAFKARQATTRFVGIRGLSSRVHAGCNRNQRRCCKESVHTFQSMKARGLPCVVIQWKRRAEAMCKLPGARRCLVPTIVDPAIVPADGATNVALYPL